MAPGLRDLSPAWLDRLADLWPHRVAVVDPDRDARYTYGDLRSRARVVASSLHGAGVRRGDRVATLVQNGLPLLDLLFACGQLGAILVILNWRLSERELADLLVDSDPVLVVAEEEYVPVARRTAPDVSVRAWADVEAGFPSGTSCLLPPLDVRLDDPWLILYTGGTTGVPKGVILTHGSVMWNAVNTALSWGLSEMDVGPSFTPMFHTGGLNVFTLPLLMLGGRVILPRRFDPASALRIITVERPTVLFLVPTMFGLVAELPGFHRADLSSLRWVISGGAPLPEPIYDQWKGKVRVFKQGYGLTEVGPNNFATPDEEALKRRGRTVGRLSLFAQARIVDDAGTEVPDGTPGELLLAGPHMCAGYWGRPEATREAMGDGWFRTGDIARRDADGFYYIVDRKKDLIISGGENIYPTEVETILYTHPAVYECAVVGVRHPVWGEAVTAVLSLHPGEQVTEEELRAWMRARLAHYKVPKQFVIVPDLPKSDAGKILRARARDLVSL